MDPNTTETPQIQWQRDQFKRPPIVKRRFVTRLDVPRHLFDEKAVSLVEDIQVAGKFDRKEMKQQWDFHLEVKNNTPRPKVKLTHSPVLIRNARNGHPKTVLELFPPVGEKPAEFILEQDRTDENGSRFEDLELECQKWLPFVMDRFDTKRLGGFLLEYRNAIKRERYPVFWEGEKKLLLGKLFWLFLNNQGPTNFVTPFSVEINTETGLEKTSNMRFQMKTIQQPGKQDFSLRATLTYSSLAREEKGPIGGLWPELKSAHELIFDNFVRQFAPTALEEFTR